MLMFLRLQATARLFHGSIFAGQLTDFMRAALDRSFTQSLLIRHRFSLVCVDVTTTQGTRGFLLLLVEHPPEVAVGRSTGVGCRNGESSAKWPWMAGKPPARSLLACMKNADHARLHAGELSRALCACRLRSVQRSKVQATLFQYNAAGARACRAALVLSEFD